MSSSTGLIVVLTALLLIIALLFSLAYVAYISFQVYKQMKKMREEVAPALRLTHKGLTSFWPLDLDKGLVQSLKKELGRNEQFQQVLEGSRDGITFKLFTHFHQIRRVGYYRTLLILPAKFLYPEFHLRTAATLDNLKQNLGYVIYPIPAAPNLIIQFNQKLNFEEDFYSAFPTELYTFIQDKQLSLIYTPGWFIVYLGQTELTPTPAAYQQFLDSAFMVYHIFAKNDSSER